MYRRGVYSKGGLPYEADFGRHAFGQSPCQVAFGHATEAYEVPAAQP
jgi:hypothetical protein